MSDDDQGPSPFERRHRAIRHMGIQRHIPAESEYRQLLYGPMGRRVKYPLMSLMHEKELGACRHALAQRVVAGTLEVTIPFGPDRLHAPKKKRSK